jgi:uncharacterized repeat protein (TIGR01451 family)
LRCTAPSVPAAPADGSSLTVTITATVPAGTANGTVLRNVTTVDGDQPEPTPDPNPNDDLTRTTVTTEDPPPEPPTPLPPDPTGPPAPPVLPASAEVLPTENLGTRLALSKRADARVVTPGETITWRLRVRNAGEAQADGVRVCDPLPAGIIAVRAAGFHRQSGALCRNVGNLAIGASRTLRITTRVSRSAPRQVTNRASAQARNARRVRARATVGRFEACPATARRRDKPVAHAAC